MSSTMADGCRQVSGRGLSDESTLPEAVIIGRESVRANYEGRSARPVNASYGAWRPKPEDERYDNPLPEEEKPKEEKPKGQHPWSFRPLRLFPSAPVSNLLIVDIQGRLVGFCGEEASVLEALILTGASGITVDTNSATTCSRLERAGVPIELVGGSARLTDFITVKAERRFGKGTAINARSAADYLALQENGGAK